MNQANLILTIDLETNTAIQQLSQNLTRQGLQVEPCFNLQSARTAQSQHICPIHDGGPCDCQLVVLLIYGGDGMPFGLMVQGCNGQTHFSVVDNALFHAAPELFQSVQQALLAR